MRPSAPLRKPLNASQTKSRLPRASAADNRREYSSRRPPETLALRPLEGCPPLIQRAHDRIELNFRRALDIADTPTDRRIARDALRYLRDTKDWNYTLFLGVAPTSNIHRQSGEFLTFHPNCSIFNQQSKPIESKTGRAFGLDFANNPSSIKVFYRGNDRIRKYFFCTRKSVPR